MAELKICRICLRTEAKVYKYDRFQLKAYYEEVLALKVDDKDQLPNYFCYECATMLHKFHKFKEKCHTGQKVLKEMLWRGSISYELVYKIDRRAYKLESPLSTFVVNGIQEYIYEEDTDVSTLDIKPENTEQKLDFEVEYFGGSLRNDNDNLGRDLTDELEIKGDPETLSVGSKDDTSQDNNDLDDPDVKIKNVSGTFSSNSKDVLVLKRIKLKRKRVPKEDSVSDSAKKRQVILDSESWNVFNLSEEEALKQFRARSEDKKYIAAAYKCADCYRGFSKEVMLKRHIKLRHCESIGEFECRFCRMRYKLECYLRKHMRQHYDKYECLRCGLVCDLEYTAFLHEEYHSGLTRKCMYCDEEFRHSSTYYTHLRTHRSEFVCAVCGASFVSGAGLHQHKRFKHVLDDAESPDDDEEVNTYCDLCDIRFETRKAYEEHLYHSVMHSNDDETEVAQVTPRKVLGKRLRAKITGETRKPRQDELQLTPVYKRKGGRRKRPSTGKKPTTCHQCGKHFDTQKACMKHHLEEHPRTSFFPSNQRHICEICGASLAPGSVATHQNMHTREKIHSCDTCGRQFHSNVSLKRHFLTHTGEKPYGCTLCDKRFTQSNSMKLHFRTFHLKQPYPKRKRWKKQADHQETMEQPESESEEADDSLHKPSDMAVLIRRTEPPLDTPGHDTEMHYLTLP